jgi:hypothetical protein
MRPVEAFVAVTDSMLVCSASSKPGGWITLKRVRRGARVVKTRVIVECRG